MAPAISHDSSSTQFDGNQVNTASRESLLARGLRPTILHEVLQERGKKWAKIQCLPEEARETQLRLLKAYQQQCRGYGGGLEGWIRNEWHPIIYCPDTKPGGEMVFRTKRKTAELYKSLLAAIQGAVHEGVQVCEIMDPIHHIKFAAPPEQSCYTLVYVGSPINKLSPRVVFGEYTGTINNGSHTVNRFEYVFDLTFCRDAWRFADEVYDDNDENESVSGNHVRLRSPKSEDDFQKVVLPGPCHFVLDSHDAYNEMSLLNHYGILAPFGDFCSKRNCEWQQVFVDGWPHVLLTSIPGVEINPGDELFADFGNDWFFKVQNDAMKSMCSELLEWRLGLRSASIRQKLFGDRPFEYINKEKDPLAIPTDLQICGICQAADKGDDDPSVHCDACDRPFHIRCLDDADLISDEYKWFCFFCVSQAEEICRHKQRTAQQTKLENTDLSDNCDSVSATNPYHENNIPSFSDKCDSVSATNPYHENNIPSLTLSKNQPLDYPTEQNNSEQTKGHSYSLVYDAKYERVYNSESSKIGENVCPNQYKTLSLNNRIHSNFWAAGKAISYLSPELYNTDKNGLITDIPLPPDGLLNQLKPCSLCYKKVGPAASVEICRLTKRHLEGNWDHPDNSTPLEIATVILVCYNTKLNELQSALTCKEANISNLASEINNLKYQRKKTTGHSRMTQDGSSALVSLNGASPLVNSAQLKGFYPLLGVHLGKTQIRTEFADGWWTGVVKSYHPISHDEDIEETLMPSLFRIVFNDGDSEWVQPEKLIEALMEQTLFASLSDRCTKYQKTSSMFSLLNPEFSKVRRLVNSYLRSESKKRKDSEIDEEPEVTNAKEIGVDSDSTRFQKRKKLK
ncbi:AP2 domain transcription factor AP2VIIa-7 [Cardiosporidium cionae]|uniref:AP2 domain transcription factor AP2VIIa-7 n=1 Tax=Cardiosporidium cionae TaxID=476202 RepID=A0ABQ7J8T1_9APIC|nr:AP2 domain transcription factor AP2VIIa-7 [Cardiosporidium cionae]|eukprot:KAF8820334.1 AP2 domain transcription factor AP2VIIa-7 [Cardiosporidium cionae]